ncbi:MAG TPA: hypothetical protein EYP86_04255 [Candidatus Altiarchaeales archaeon]|nr:hypothetical protein [Candidatus Altiarchaeales archaeon]
MEFNLYRTDWTMTDEISTHWSYRDSMNRSHSRGFGYQQNLSDCSSMLIENANITIRDMRTDTIL